jgi:regulator of protease activity HflC (stomatin/prohibitin superfamily)
VFDLGEIAAQQTGDGEPPMWNNMKSLIMGICMLWVLLTTVVVAGCVISGLAIPVVLLVLGGMLIAGMLIIVRLYLAKSSALSGKQKTKPVLGGFSTMVLWEPTEGVVFLKNKQVQAVDNNPNDGGGIRFIFPVLGEELGMRAPLTLQSTMFTDHNVFTKDYLPVTIRMTLWWRLTDLERYYLSISKDLGSVSDAGRDDWESDGGGPVRSSAGELGMAKSWISMMAESVGRKELAKTSTAFLVAGQISSELPRDLQNQMDGGHGQIGSMRSYQETTETLSNSLQHGVREKIADCGINIERVEVQEIRLPKDIHDAAVAACSAAFSPAKAEREAAARKLQLQMEAEVLGADAVALREVLGSAEGMSFLGVPDFLENLFGKLGQNRRLTNQKT